MLRKVGKLMDEKITKKNSIIYNQLWTLKAIEEGYIEFLPLKKSHLSIGEQIERKYNKYLPIEFPKLTRHTSLLYELEWIKKAKMDGVHIPKPSLKYNRGEILALLYLKKERLNAKGKPKDVLKLKKEKK